ncbi:FMN-dependent NADH-azoreductase (plasmid) [Microvirga terrae]|uniref:FMN dependent NADH:quinone oxidoreductase n=1 Tax=Microvirga terrae TaxID=2740529 RepID=A0ABY5S2L6_9HYPH|nr:FMN-dependent NADH-azoreductase [Microvirga terrae]UVF22647.1 FMN-dependent NADH-azoreductase [Microvirga terrae]
MSTALVITSSALGEASVSSQLVEETVARLRSHDPALRVIARDLGRNPVPHLDIDSAAALRGAEPSNYAQVNALSLSNDLIAELKTADTLVIGAPMYNFGMPSTLKAWFDHVLRAGITFSYSESGPEGLIKGKRAFVVESRGGLYSEGPAQPMDSQEPHLRNLLAFMGITDVTFLRAEKLAFGPEAREQAIEAVRQQIGKTVGEACRKAA